MEGRASFIMAPGAGSAVIFGGILAEIEVLGVANSLLAELVVSAQVGKEKCQAIKLSEIRNNKKKEINLRISTFLPSSA